MKYLEEYLQSQLFLSKEIKILLSFGEENNELQAGVGLRVGDRYPTLIWVKSSNRWVEFWDPQVCLEIWNRQHLALISRGEGCLGKQQGPRIPPHTLFYTEARVAVQAERAQDSPSGFPIALESWKSFQHFLGFSKKSADVGREGRRPKDPLCGWDKKNRG